MIKEIGIRRIIKYLVYGLWDFVFRLLPYSPLRVLWLKIGGANVAWTAIVDRVDFINLDRTGLFGLKLGNKSFLGCRVVVDLAGKILIGEQVTISPAAVVLSHFSVGFKEHPLIIRYPKKVETTVVSEGAFVGVNSTILSGVKIGRHSMIAAGSVVTSDVPDNVLMAGIPAKVKKQI